MVLHVQVDPAHARRSTFRLVSGENVQLLTIRIAMIDRAVLLFDLSAVLILPTDSAFSSIASPIMIVHLHS
jgi:hypothetical protein